MSEEKPEPDDANENDGDSEPGAIEEFVQRAAVSRDHAFNEVAGPLFHAGTFMTSFSFAQNSGAHQRRKGERNQPRGKNCDDDGHRKFAEDAAKQTGKKN